MAIDQKALRKAYYSPPPEGEFLDIPTREEYMAEAERWFVQLCLERGGDPEAEGLGEHGALIGGPGKPVRLLVGHSRPFEQYARPRLAPLDWFERPAVRSGKRPAGPRTPLDAEPGDVLHGGGAGRKPAIGPAAVRRLLRGGSRGPGALLAAFRAVVPDHHRASLHDARRRAFDAHGSRRLAFQRGVAP